MALGNTIQKQKNNSSDCFGLRQKARWFLVILGIMASLAFFINLGIGTYFSLNLFNDTITTSHEWTREFIKENRNVKDIYQSAIHSITENDTTAIIDRAKFYNKHPDHTTLNTSSQNCSTYFKKRHFLTTSYPGRTGNLLFKFAVLIATAELTCYTAVRKPEVIAHLDNIVDIKGVPKMRHGLASFKNLYEPGWSIYDDKITSHITPDFNWTLVGFRQSFRYFQNHASLVRSSFFFKDSIKKDVKRYLNSTPLAGSIKVCLHVRRSNGLTSSDRKKGNHISELAYINNSIEYMETHVRANNFSLLVASDNIQWCESNIKGGHVRYSPFKDSGRDLYLLTQCDHNIITTGTFGWMGAWLNETGVVIYDKLFPFPNSKLYKGHKPADYYPRHWIGL